MVLLLSWHSPLKQVNKETDQQWLQTHTQKKKKSELYYFNFTLYMITSWRILLLPELKFDDFYYSLLSHESLYLSMHVPGPVIC